METLPQHSKVAVIGAGIAGISAAYYLQKKFSVTLFEAEDRLGGHTNTISVQDPELGQIGIDTGFIVLNDRSYPTLQQFFKDLNVPVRFSDMSFSVVCEKSKVIYGSKNLRAIIGHPSNLIRATYYRMLLDFPKFWKKAALWLSENPTSNISVAEFVKDLGLSQDFTNNFIVPMGAAIWSSPDSLIAQFPARFFLRFFKNHGMLTLADQPRWQTVAGGSWQYLKAFEKAFSGNVTIGQPVLGVKRTKDRVYIKTAQIEQEFDHVVLAVHADQALKILSDADDFEKSLLSAWEYQANHAVLHYDESYLPKYIPARASWNYQRQVGDVDSQPLSITYFMNLLQGLDCQRKYCVTLNPGRAINPDKIIYQTTYQHPQYSLAAERAQAKLAILENRSRTSFCGSYFGFGFHEDGCKSGVAVAKKLGAYL